MAATITFNYAVEMDPHVVDKVVLTSCTSDLLESIVPASALVATGKAMKPELAKWQITTPPASRCPVNVSLESQSETTGAQGVRIWGGDLTGMVIELYFKYNSMKAGGISA